MPGIFLAVDSQYEELTQAAALYREARVYPYLQNKGWQLHPLYQRDAVEQTVLAALGLPGVNYLTGVGHGDSNIFTGYCNQEVLQVGDYDPALVAGKIVHLLSCSTGAGLGPDLVANGCLAFFGYSAPFTYDPSISDVFFECDAQVDLALADGLTAAAAGQQAITLFTQRISELQTAGNYQAAAYLQTNLQCFCSPQSSTPRWGDPNAKLS
jgi:hypothetical protein